MRAPGLQWELPVSSSQIGGVLTQRRKDAKGEGSILPSSGLGVLSEAGARTSCWVWVGMWIVSLTRSREGREEGWVSAVRLLLAVSMRLRRGRGSRGAAEVAENGTLECTSGQSPVGEWLPTLESSGAPLSPRSPRLRVRRLPHGYGLAALRLRGFSLRSLHGQTRKAKPRRRREEETEGGSAPLRLCARMSSCRAAVERDEFKSPEAPAGLRRAPRSW